MRDVMAQYVQSPAFKRLKPSSQESYRLAMNAMWPMRDAQIATVRRHHIYGVQDDWAEKPAMANLIVAVWSRILQFAVDREIIFANVAAKIPKLPTGEYRRWSDDHIAYALERFPKWGRRAVMLALYTGQRCGDLTRMTRSDYDGSGIQVRQEKTGATLWVACHKTLRVELDGDDGSSLYLLHRDNGQPFRSKTLSRSFRDQIAKHDFLKGLVLHGLRKSAAARLAEAGCSVHEIAAITGHQSLEMIAHYTAEADQKRNAMAAIVKLERRK